MGVCGSKGGDLDAVNGSDVALSEHSSDVSQSFVDFSVHEQAEEREYLQEEAGDMGIEPLLLKRFPDKAPEAEGIAEFKAHIASIPEEKADFDLSPPYTLKKANAFCKYLHRSDAKHIPRRVVYEVVTAAAEHFEKMFDEHGALQQVPPPETPDCKLYICGDTHGQLQDVLWIFREHGTPAPGNAFLFNGDIADRGKWAVEIFVLLLAFKLAAPKIIYFNRGNHEQRDLNERPFANGGGFAWEVRSKYPHDERLIDLFQLLFNAMPIASVVGQWAFIIHGGLFREPNVTLADIAAIQSRRQPPNVLETKDDRLLFDALWADPHPEQGVRASPTRGGFSVQFGRDVTRAFCERNNVQSVIRSHQLPPKQRGYEIQHDAMLLTIFSASNYGGVGRNRGGVLIFDHKGPAEVKEFYAPPLQIFRSMYEEALVDSVRPRLAAWSSDARQGSSGRLQRQRGRTRRDEAQERWFHLLFRRDSQGRVLKRSLRTDDALRAEHGIGQQPIKSGSSIAATIFSIKSDLNSSLNKSSKYSLPLTSTEYATTTDDAPTQGSLTPRAGTKVTRISIASASLRSNRRSGDRASGEPAELGSASDEWRPGERVVTSVVYAAERDLDAQVSEEILLAMRMQICRFKGQLTASFVKAGAQSGSGSGRGSMKMSPRSTARLREHNTQTLSYDQWQRVMCEMFPEYPEPLMRSYGPRLLDVEGRAKKTGPAWSQKVRESPVQYMRWLDRFQIRLRTEACHVAFERFILQRLHSTLVERTKQMSVTELLSYFDPNNDGSMRQTHVEHALAALQLGLSAHQLQQLVYELGFVDPHERVDPVEVITALVAALAPSLRPEQLPARSRPPTPPNAGAARAAATATSTAPAASSASGSSTDSRTSGRRLSDVHRLNLIRMRRMLQQNKEKVQQAFDGGSLMQIFHRFDVSRTGVLSYEETAEVLTEMQDICGQSIVSGHSREELVQHMDLAKTGFVTFVEFASAFGLSDEDETPEADESEMVECSTRFVLEMMQQILSSLYERSHAMQKAFHYLDTDGAGWLPEADFREALQLVLAEDPTHNSVLLSEQVQGLVRSLRGTRLTDAKGRFDYCGFLQDFDVVDTASLPSKTTTAAV